MATVIKVSCFKNLRRKACEESYKDYIDRLNKECECMDNISEKEWERMQLESTIASYKKTKLSLIYTAGISTSLIATNYLLVIFNFI